MHIFRPGDDAYFISNNTHVIKATVKSISGSLYTVTFPGVTNEACAAIRLKASRLYATEEEAETHLPKHIKARKQAEKEQKEQVRGFRAPGWH